MHIHPSFDFATVKTMGKPVLDYSMPIKLAFLQPTLKLPLSQLVASEKLLEHFVFIYFLYCTA